MRLALRAKLLITTRSTLSYCCYLTRGNLVNVSPEIASVNLLINYKFSFQIEGKMSEPGNRIEMCFDGMERLMECVVHHDTYSTSTICPCCSQIICRPCLDQLEAMRERENLRMHCPHCQKHVKKVSLFKTLNKI
jgi:hypothetical protein